MAAGGQRDAKEGLGNLIHYVSEIAAEQNPPEHGRKAAEAEHFHRAAQALFHILEFCQHKKGA